MTTPSTITVAPVTPAEHEIAIGLTTNAEQTKFVATNHYSLRQAAEQPECKPMLIRSGGEPVGFAMYAVAPEDNEYWIYRFMIDSRYQRQGLGSRAIGVLTQHIFDTHSDCARILLGVVPGNPTAWKLYEQAGFVDANYQIEGEDVMILDRRH